MTSRPVDRISIGLNVRLEIAAAMLATSSARK
jgi:hypothetical protein